MTEFTFYYSDTPITYTYDMLGREKLYVNDELIKSSINWLKQVVTIEFSLNNETLKLTRNFLSCDNGECQVSLSNDKKVIDKQTKLIIDLSYDGSETVYQNDEYEWIKEIKTPNSAIRYGWLMYFLIVFHGFSDVLFSSTVIHDVTGWIVCAATAIAILMFFVLGIKEVFRGTSSFN